MFIYNNLLSFMFCLVLMLSSTQMFIYGTTYCSNSLNWERKHLAAGTTVGLLNPAVYSVDQAVQFACGGWVCDVGRRATYSYMYALRFLHKYGKTICTM